MIDTVALREKVLDLAIRGKLVPQDPNDEPASVLLERIREQKQQMVKEGKLKAKDIKDDSVIFVGDDNLHYEKFTDGNTICIEEETELMWPSTWVATRLKNIIELLSGRDLSPNQYTDIPNGIPYITGASNFLCGEIKTDRFTPVPQVIVYKGDLLITCKGTVGELAYCPYEQAHIARQIMAIRNSFGLNLEYICNCVRFYVEKIKNSAKGLIPGISREDMLNLIIPLPPLNEQVKINSQINVLMKSIKSIDEKSQSLTTDIGNLKSKILDLAIRGKLVSQNPDDEPASMLLERIREEKEELIKQGKIKRDKNESIIFKGEDNSYYENLPESWAITKLGLISSVITKGTTPRGGNITYLDNGIGFLRAENIEGYDKLNLQNLKFIDENTHNGFLKRSILKNDDILITIAGTLGRTAIVTKDVLPLNTNQAVAIIRLVNPLLVNNRFIAYAINSNSIKKALLQQEVAMAIPNLSLENIHESFLPLPPLNEQLAIVEVIDKLFMVIDDIEKSLK